MFVPYHESNLVRSSVTELCAFAASDAYLSDPSLPHAAFDLIANVDGHISSYQGIQIEDKTTGYMVLAWETLEHHKKLMKHESYQTLLKATAQLYTGDFQMEHVPFNKPIIEAMAAPVTEIISFTLKPGKLKDDLMPLLDKLFKVVDTLKGIHPPAVFGSSIEKEDRVVGLLGWDSVEAHKEAIKDEELRKVVSEVVDIAELRGRHIPFTKH